MAARERAAASSPANALRTRELRRWWMMLERGQWLGAARRRSACLNACIKTGTKRRQLVAATGDARQSERSASATRCGIQNCRIAATMGGIS